VILCLTALAVTLAALFTPPRIFRLQWLATFAIAIVATAWASNGDLHDLGYGIGGGRYFVMPIALCIVAVLAASCDRVWRRSAVRVGVLLPTAGFFTYAVSRDARLPDLPPTHWAETARCIRSHQPCQVVVNPFDFSFPLPPIPGAY
jgi:hypothetical protein